MRLLAALLAAACLDAGDALPRLPTPEQGGALPKIATTGPWQAHLDGITAWLTATWPALQRDDPGVADLAEMLARWTHTNNGVAAIVPKYATIFIGQFNRYQEMREAVESSRLPAACRGQWLRFLAERLVRERLDIDAKRWGDALAGIAPGGSVVSGDAAAIAAGIRAAIQGWDGLAAEERRRLLHGLAEINPALRPDGWCILDQAPADIPGCIMAATPVAGGRVLVERWIVGGGESIYIPPRASIRGPAPAMPDAGPAAPPGLTLVRCVLDQALDGGVPLHLQLAFRDDGGFDNGVATAPTWSNRAWPILPVIGDPDLDHPDGGAPVRSGDRVAGKVRIAIATPGKTRYELALALQLAADGSGTAICTIGKGPPASLAARPAPAADPVQVAAGAEWGNWMGTRMRAAAAGSGLVADLEDAALAWAADDDMATGRGPDSRGKAKTLAPGEALSGTYATPVVAGGLVFTTSFEPSGDALAYGAKDAQLNRINLIAADDLVIATDLASGRVRWQRRFPGGVNWAGFNKGGPKLSAAVADGIVVAVGTTGWVRGLDAATGALRWQNDIGYRHRQLRGALDQLLRDRTMLSTRNDLMIDPVVIDGAVLVGDARMTKMDYRYEVKPGMLAFDLRTGRRLWAQPELAPPNRFYQGAQLIELAGRAWALIPHTAGIALIDPRTGERRWDCADATLHQSGIAQLGDLVLAEEVRPAAADKAWTPGLVAIRISAEGGSVAWRADPAVRLMAGNPIARDGRFWVGVERPQRQLVALSAADGKIELTLPLAIAGGEHCPYLVDAGDRLILPSDRTAGLWSVAPDPARPDPRYWPAELATGYCGSILPAVVDGRMLLRAYDRLLCYDLRQQAAPARTHGQRWPRAAPPAKERAADDKDD